MMLRGMVASASSGNICPESMASWRWEWSRVMRVSEAASHTGMISVAGASACANRTEMVGAGIADIDHIGLVREVLIIGVTEQSSAAGAGGIRMILGQYQTGAGCAGHAAKAVSQIENVVLGPCQGVVDILTGA